MGNYLFELSCCWLAFYAFYQLFLQKETFFRFNRFYLLAVLALSLFIPVAQFPWSSPLEGYQFTAQLPVVTVLNGPAPVIPPETVDMSKAGVNWLNWIWLAGIALMLGRILWGLRQIARLYAKGEITRQDNYWIVRTPEQHLPFSFFRLLFWSRHLSLSGPDARKIQQHEEAHIVQGHYFDLIFLEILGTVFWFHPLVYLYKRSLRDLHEYLADDYVLQTTPALQYGHLLLRQAQPGLELALTSDFFPTQLKKRIQMMTKHRSSDKAVLKYLFAVPVVGLLVLLFSAKPIFAQLEGGPMATMDPYEQSPALQVLDPISEPDVMPRFPGCEEVADPQERKLCAQKHLFQFIFSHIKYPKEAFERNIEGTAVVEFIVAADGSIRNATLLKDPGYGTGEEALRTVNEMPRWIPGTKDDKPVDVKMTLPIRFEMPAKKLGKTDEFDRFPAFPGCDAQELSDEALAKCSINGLMGYAGKNLSYPKEAEAAGIEGPVVVKFVIGADGKVKNSEIVKSMGESLDQEVLRLIGSLPTMTPGQKDGKAVDVELTLPIKFQLSDDDRQKAGKAPVKADLLLPVENFRAYPNPTDTQIQLEGQLTAGPTSIRIMDLAGKVVYNTQLNEFDGHLNLPVELQETLKGEYIVSIMQGGRIFSHKIVLR